MDTETANDLISILKEAIEIGRKGTDGDFTAEGLALTFIVRNKLEVTN